MVIRIEDINDNSPEFGSSFYSSEMSYKDKSGTVVSTITATDADSGVNSILSYSMKENYGLFTIDAETGKHIFLIEVFYRGKNK